MLWDERKKKMHITIALGDGSLVMDDEVYVGKRDRLPDFRDRLFKTG